MDQTTTRTHSSRRQAGLAIMQQIHGEEAASQIVAGFDAVGPDFGTYVLEAGFADIYARPGLTLAQRQLLNVAVLTALGDSAPQLTTHILFFMRIGVTENELIEAILH